MRPIDADALKEEVWKAFPHFLERLQMAPVFKLIREAPTIDAEPEQKWIPVSERPFIDGQYIVSLIDDTGCLFTDVAEWSNTFGGRWRALFVDDNDYAEICDIDNVVAWMPLPEAYAERREKYHDNAC